MSTVHVYPLKDEIEHVLEGVSCPCGIRTEEVVTVTGKPGYLHVHNSLDGREVSGRDHSWMTSEEIPIRIVWDPWYVRLVKRFFL